MAKAKDKGHDWQKHADHCNDIILKMTEEVLKDPDSTPEEITEANQTIEDMNRILQRLKNRLAAEPTPVEPTPT